MRIFFYLFLFRNRLFKTSKLLLNNNNETFKNVDNKIYISKQYLYNIINRYYDSTEYNSTEYDSYDNSYNLDHLDNSTENNSSENKINVIMDGINYAYPYDDLNILDDIKKNLYLQEKNKILINPDISIFTKLNIANEYLTMNDSLYKNNIKNGGLYDDWFYDIE